MKKANGTALPVLSADRAEFEAIGPTMTVKSEWDGALPVLTAGRAEFEAIGPAMTVKSERDGFAGPERRPSGVGGHMADNDRKERTGRLRRS